MKEGKVVREETHKPGEAGPAPRVHRWNIPQKWGFQVYPEFNALFSAARNGKAWWERVHAVNCMAQLAAIRPGGVSDKNLGHDARSLMGGLTERKADVLEWARRAAESEKDRRIRVEIEALLKALYQDPPKQP